MKKIKIFILISTMVIGACKKPAIKQATTPASMFFEIIGKDGETMIHSLNDSIRVSYTDNGITRNFKMGIIKLNSAIANDSINSLKYNGFYTLDSSRMSNLSSREPVPVRNFVIYLNGVNSGNIYLDYWGYLEAYPKLSSNALTFNSIPVYQDSTIPHSGR